MKRSFLSRIAGAAVALGLGTTTLAVIGLATPASAVVTCTSRVTAHISQTRVEYGTRLYVDGSVKHTCPGEPESSTYVGQAVLQRALAGQGWTNVAVESASGFFYYEVTASANASYRIVYQGGDESSDRYPAKASDNVG